MENLYSELEKINSFVKSEYFKEKIEEEAPYIFDKLTRFRDECLAGKLNALQGMFTPLKERVTRSDCEKLTKEFNKVRANAIFLYNSFRESLEKGGRPSRYENIPSKWKLSPDKFPKYLKVDAEDLSDVLSLVIYVEESRGDWDTVQMLLTQSTIFVPILYGMRIYLNNSAIGMMLEDKRDKLKSEITDAGLVVLFNTIVTYNLSNNVVINNSNIIDGLNALNLGGTDNVAVLVANSLRGGGVPSSSLIELERELISLGKPVGEKEES